MKTNSEDRRDHLMASVTANSDEERRRAVLACCAHADSLEDARMLLDALGLLPAPREAS